MSIHFKEENGGKAIVVHVSGKLASALWEDTKFGVKHFADIE